MTSKKPSEKSANSKSYKLDPVAFSHQMTELFDRLAPLVKEYQDKKPVPESAPDPLNIQPAFMKLYENALQNPQGLLDLQIEYMQNLYHLWQETSKKFLGEQSEEVIKPDIGDKRFKDPLWNENAGFDFIKQSYLLTSQMLKKYVHSSEGLDKKEKAKLDFYTRQFVDSMAPTNFALTNPVVLKETLDSKGQNLMKGFENLIADLERGNGELQIKKTNYDAFEVGKNLAITAGKVVYQNDLMQLIQYTPSTEEVFETPLLIVPPWINKYYILDMRPDNSFIKWAVDQGHTVFVVSWVNPGQKLAKKNFYSYIEEGILSALTEIEKITDQNKTNVVGYCIGGTLLASALGYMAKKDNQERIASATFLTTLIDFSDAGDLAVFIDDEQLDALDKKMLEKGYLEGAELRNTFSLLRANDLIWSYVVNNYMLGKEPFQFDLLYWNDDSTNMPAAMHSFYLRKMYRENLLCRPDAMTLNDTPIDLRKVNVPSYFLSTKEDHIAPWKSTFEGMRSLGGDKTFTLSASGHVAGVVNPPAAQKYQYWTSHIDNKDKPDDWLERASLSDGSWWPHWAKWLEQFSDKKIKARTPQNAIEDAPGSYVRMKAS